MNKTSEQMDALSPEERRELLAQMLKQRGARLKTAPLSFDQERFWFLDQMDPGSSLYNMLVAVRLTGSLDVQALEHSLNQVVQRHEMLRTTFTSAEGAPVQVVAPALSLSMTCVDLRDVAPDEREARAREQARDEAQYRFDLTRGPLLRATLLQLAAQDHVLVLVLHHIISDAWSMGVLVREVAAFYQARVTQEPLALPDLPLQYAEYASWQRGQWEDDPRMQEDMGYWKQQLAGPLPVLEMITTAADSGPAKLVRRTETFSTEFATELKAFSREQGVTLFVTLLAAFKTLLYRCTGQTDIIIGSPIANRDRSELEALIGFFINTLVLRTDLSGNPSFATLLQRVKQVVLDAFSHKDISFARLVDELQPTRDITRNPIFQIVFILQPPRSLAVTLPDLTINTFSVGNVEGEAPDTMGMAVHDTPEGLTMVIEYRTDMVNQEALEQFQILLAAVIRNPDLKLSDIPLLSETAQRQTLSWSKPVQAPPEKRSLVALFESQVARVPDNIAVACGDARLTYRALNQRANQLAHYLRRQGVRANDLIGLCVNRSTEMMVGMMGILKAGAAYLPLDPTYPPERLEFMVSRAGATMLLTQHALLSGVPEGRRGRAICLDADWDRIARESDRTPDFPVLDDSLMYVIYTSGSTGMPKGAGVYKHSFVNLMRWYIDAFGLSEDDSTLIVSSMSFDLTQKNFYGPLLTGGTLHLLPSAFFDPQEILDIITTQHVTWVNCTPSAFYPLVDYAAAQSYTALASMRYVFLGGEPIAVSRLRPWLTSEACQGQLVNTYGPTECTDLCLFYALEDPRAFSGQALPLGKPLDNTQVLLLDDALRLVPPGVLGEIHIGGLGVGMGYLGEARLTATRFVPHPYAVLPDERIYKTGDLGYYLSDGTLVYAGRRDHQIKLHGFRIELGEIEMALARHPSVKEAVVLVHDNEQNQGVLVAYVVLQPGSSEPHADDLRVHLQEHLPGYMIPASFVTLTAFPLTPNGKVDRNALRLPEGIPAQQAAEFVPPEGPIEEKLAEIWRTTLNVQRVGVYDDFFELGGHSLLATQVAYQVSQAFQIQLPVRSVFEEPTLAELALLIEEMLLDELDAQGGTSPEGA